MATRTPTLEPISAALARGVRVKRCAVGQRSNPAAQLISWMRADNPLPLEWRWGDNKSWYRCSVCSKAVKEGVGAWRAVRGERVVRRVCGKRCKGAVVKANKGGR